MLPPKRRRRVLSNVLPPGGGVTLRPPVRHANGSDARPAPGQPLRGSAGSDTKLALHHVGGGVYSLRPPCSEEAPRERERKPHLSDSLSQPPRLRCPTCEESPHRGHFSPCGHHVEKTQGLERGPSQDAPAVPDTGPRGGPCPRCPAGPRTEQKGGFTPLRLRSLATQLQVAGKAGEQRGQPCGCVLGGPRGAADLALAGGSSSASGEGGVAYQAGRTVATRYDGKNCFPRGQPGRPNPA